MTTLTKEYDTRVEIPAHYDAWMRGDRFGKIVRADEWDYYVRMEKSGRTFRFNKTVLKQLGRFL